MLELRFSDRPGETEIVGKVFPNIISNEWLSERGTKIDLVDMLSTLHTYEIRGDKASLKAIRYYLTQALHSKETMIANLQQETENIRSVISMIDSNQNDSLCSGKAAD